MISNVKRLMGMQTINTCKRNIPIFKKPSLQTRLPLNICCTILISMLGTMGTVGCSNGSSTDTTANTDASTNTHSNSPDTDTNVLTILAGSELKDIEPLLGDIKQNTGIELRLEYTGTIDGVNAISQGKPVDAAWFSHGKYLSLANRDKIKAQNPIMLSPVVMGIKQSKAEALGWLNSDGDIKPSITWESIADASHSGKLKYAMTNPAASNSGFTALMGVTSAFVGTSDAPTAKDVATAKPRLKEFFSGQALTSGSSGWLAEAYLKEQDRLDAIINYESVLIELNKNGQLSEPLLMIYPKEGIVTADYPLALLNFAKKDSYDKVVDYLKTESVQRRLMTQTSRRPVNTQVALDDKFYSGLLVELPFPNSLQVIDGLLIDFANELRNPAYSVFLLDVSGSMEGDGIAQLQQALLDLSGATHQSGKNIGRFTQFATNEVVALKPFDDDTYELQDYTISEQTLPRLRDNVNKLKTDSGGTAIYSALLDGYNTIYEQKRQLERSNNDNPSYYYSIVLMTDGVNQDGLKLSNFKDAYQHMHPDQQRIKTFVVLFGDADEGEMQQIANLTGGKVFDGRNGNLTEVFRKIRGYQ